MRSADKIRQIKRRIWLAHAIAAIRVYAAVLGMIVGMVAQTILLFRDNIPRVHGLSANTDKHNLLHSFAFLHECTWVGFIITILAIVPYSDGLKHFHASGEGSGMLHGADSMGGYYDIGGGVDGHHGGGNF